MLFRLTTDLEGVNEAANDVNKIHFKRPANIIHRVVLMIASKFVNG